jgi:RNA polymerase sigma factor (sigma-70 family)
VAQEGVLRAFKFFGGFRGGDGRAWLLTIVRNTFHTRLRRNRAQEAAAPFGPETHGIEGSDPGSILLEGADRQALRQAVEELPVEFREVLVLREFEELSYAEIAGIVDVPVGTVMSRLAGARELLHLSLVSCRDGGRSGR